MSLYACTPCKDNSGVLRVDLHSCRYDNLTRFSSIDRHSLGSKFSCFAAQRLKQMPMTDPSTPLIKIGVSFCFQCVVQTPHDDIMRSVSTGVQPRTWYQFVHASQPVRESKIMSR
jgi:hypothetical protein